MIMAYLVEAISAIDNRPIQICIFYTFDDALKFRDFIDGILPGDKFCGDYVASARLRFVPFPANE